MPVSVLILAAALAQPSPAEAALPDILIPQLRLGMDKQQFHALWPKYRATFGPGCTAKINATIRDHKLYSVELESPEKEPNLACGKFVSAWAHAAFGKPKDSGDSADSGNCVPGGFAYQPLGAAQPCGPQDVADWANWELQDKKYAAGVQAQRKGGWWWLWMYPR